MTSFSLSLSRHPLLLAVVALLLPVGFVALSTNGSRPKSEPPPASALSFEDKLVAKEIETAMKTAFGTDLRTVKVVPASEIEKDSYVVFVSFNATRGNTAAETRTVVQIQMMQGYEALYRMRPWKLAGATLSAHLPKLDNYGRAKDSVVYRTTLIGVEARKIVWENAEQLDFTKLWSTDKFDAEQFNDK